MLTTPTTAVNSTDAEGVDPIPPAGATSDDWQTHDDGQRYRIIYGTSRDVPGCPGIAVQPTAVQFGDGSIDDGSVIERPGVHVDGGGGWLTVDQARRLASAITDAADDIARWTGGTTATADDSGTRSARTPQGV